MRFVLLLLFFIGCLEAHKMQENYLHIYENNNTVAIIFEIETRLLENETIDDSHNGIISFKELRHHQKELLAYIFKHIDLQHKTKSLNFLDANVTFHRYKSQTYMQIEKTFSHLELSKLHLVYNLFFDKEKNHKLLIKVDKKYDAIVDRTTPDFTFKIFYMNSWQRFSLFVQEGVQHILDGVDHLLFVLMLLISSVIAYDVDQKSKKERFLHLIKIITTFSIAHSLTLFISGMKLYIPNVTFVESAIAFSIFVAALLNLLGKYDHLNYKIVFLFGLVHGFGFANVLEIAHVKDTMEFVVALFGFNVGVELGQIAVIILVLPVLFFVMRFSYATKMLHLLCFGTMMISGYWFVERIGLV